MIMGQVIQAGTGQITARQAAVKGGIPMNVPAITINKVCLSGINAIAMADQLIRAGEHEIVVAGGMESMTNAPHLLPKSREGFKYGDTALVDSMAYDALFDQFTTQAMGMLTEQCNAAGADLTREEQDEFSARSHQRAAEAWKNGVFDDEVVPVTIKGRGGDTQVTSDEGVRGDTTAESLGKLRPAFSKEGTITAGSSSQISDGACAVVVMSKAKAEELGLEWLCEIGASGQVAGPDSTLQLQPVRRDREGGARRRASRSTDIDLFELNEAFAAVGIASARELGIDDDKVNVNGGAIAVGHPVGMSGARIVLHLALELKRRGGGTGAAALCGGGGQGDALIIRVPPDPASLTPTRVPEPDVERLVEDARAGRARAVGRLISLVEEESPALRRGHRADRPAHRAAPTSSASPAPRASASPPRPRPWSPRCARRGKRVAVLAVDPSSPFSGGALLGDRVRMGEHATDPGVFIRSMAARGHLGGLSWATPQAVRVLDVAGLRRRDRRDRRGRAERGRGGRGRRHHGRAARARAWATASRRPRPGSSRSATSTWSTSPTATVPRRCAATCGPCWRSPTGAGRRDAEHVWRPPVLGTVATSGEGVAEVVDALEEHRAWSRASGALERRRRRRARDEVEAIALARCGAAGPGSPTADRLEDLAEPGGRARPRPLRRRRRLLGD